MKKLTKFPPGTPVWIIWSDSMMTAGWTGDRETAETGRICTVGMVVKDARPKAIKITSSISDEGPILSPLTIPGTAIIKIGEMKEGKYD